MDRLYIDGDRVQGAANGFRRAAGHMGDGDRDGGSAAHHAEDAIGDEGLGRSMSGFGSSSAKMNAAAGETLHGLASTSEAAVAGFLLKDKGIADALGPYLRKAAR